MREWLAEFVASLSRESFDMSLAIVWSIWKEHNSFVWSGSALDPLDIYSNTLTWLNEYKKWHESVVTREIKLVVASPKNGSSPTVIPYVLLSVTEEVERRREERERESASVVFGWWQGSLEWRMRWRWYCNFLCSEHRDVPAGCPPSRNGRNLLTEILAAREVVDFGRQLAVTQVTFEGDALLVLKALQWDATANNGPCGHSIT
ncbi:hypothetical protein DVH24_010885 [Malus domestica]|uniref:RNase H type-1 domain-containing protein n=1 Tax=Malus domestica TaxID=3750 RepID=A0A498JT01_MALDO|nr:hypothetical protein DVH24_010885 [Malus domestica]